MRGFDSCYPCLYVVHAPKYLKNIFLHTNTNEAKFSTKNDKPVPGKHAVTTIKEASTPSKPHVTRKTVFKPLQPKRQISHTKHESSLHKFNFKPGSFFYALQAGPKAKRRTDMPTFRKTQGNRVGSRSKFSQMSGGGEVIKELRYRSLKQSAVVSELLEGTYRLKRSKRFTKGITHKQSVEGAHTLLNLADKPRPTRRARRRASTTNSVNLSEMS